MAVCADRATRLMERIEGIAMKKALCCLVALGFIMVGCGGDTGAAKKETKPATDKKEEKKAETKK
jgi:hypothetical protein